MKKNLYRIGLLRRLSGLAFALVLAAPLSAQMTWTGAENENFTYENNWDPAGDVSGQDVIIPRDSSYTYAPVITGSTDIALNSLNIYTADTEEQRPTLTINFDTDETTLTLATGNDGGTDWNFTGIVLKRGTFQHRSKDNIVRMQSNDCFIIVEGGTFIIPKNLLMGNSAGTTGGQVQITGGTFQVGSLGRFYLDREGGQFIITGDGKLVVEEDFSQDYVDNGWINGGSEYSIVRTYDAVANTTTFSAVSNDAFLISNSDRQVFTAGGTGTEINLLITERVTNAQSLVWKYRMEGEETYQEFTPAETGTSFTPSFAEPGTYFVRCEGVDAEGVDVQTDDVEIYVGSDKISITPYFDTQFVRVDTTLYTLTAEIDGVYSDIEWKYSTTPGGPYLSFDPMANTESYAPKFAETGNHYLVVEATIDGVSQRSIEILFVVEGLSSVAKSLTWTGAFSADANYAANFDPAAASFKNALVFNAGTPYDAVFSSASNDTIYKLEIYDALVTVDKPDTSIMNLRADVYVDGKFVIKSGTVDHTTTYFRIEHAADTVVVEEDGVLKVLNVLMSYTGSGMTDGGTLVLKDNAQFFTDAAGRFDYSNDSTSRIWIDDAAVAHFTGQQLSFVQALIDSGKIACNDINFEPYLWYDNVAGYTMVKALDTRAFALADDAKQYVGVDTPVGTALSTVNGDYANLTSFAWYWSTSSTGPWTMFEGSENQATYSPQFSESGTYFVIAIGSDGTNSYETQNVATIEVVGLSISPESQEMLAGQGNQMEYILTEGVTLVSREWYDLTLGEENAVLLSTDSLYTPSFTELGTYTIAMVATVADEFSQQYYLVATATVKVVSELTSVGDVRSEEISIYPNPSNGTFYVNSGGEFSVEVLDMSGTVIFSQSNLQSGQPLTISQKGIFLVKVTSANGQKVGRLVVK
jgi:hypothetical protein